MGTWHVPADVLADSGFAISPKAEVVAALGALTLPRTPEERTFAAAHGAAWASWLGEHPVAADLVAASARPRGRGRVGWLADFLCFPADVAEPTIEYEIDLLGRLSDEDIRADLYETAQAPLPASLTAPGVRDVAVDLVRWIWTHTLETDWPRRLALLRADIVARTAQLARHGWSAVLRDLGRDTEWVGDGHLRINRYDLPARNLDEGSRLVFVPTHGAGSWVGWHLDDDPRRYAIYYPLAGRLAGVGSARAAGLAPLIGSNRATLLLLLDVPRSTSQLVALSGLPLGSVSRHLRVLLDGGIVLRRRSGREVLYWRTGLGDGLVAAGAPDRGRPPAQRQP